LTSLGAVTRFAPLPVSAGPSYARFAKAPRSAVLLPGPDPHIAEFLGGAGLRDPAALRHADGRGHVPYGHDAALAGAKALERRLCAALAPPDRRPLWREPQPAAALLPVPGHPEALAPQYPGSLPGLARRHRARRQAAR